MGRFALKEADITRLALCKVGANRQRVFLLKSGDGDDREHHAFARLIKEPSADWRVAYVPVAVPDADEDQGIFATGQGDVDVWDSPEEIAKAAHSFMRNGQQLVSQHFDNAQAPGVRLVESAVALNDFNVGDTRIAKGTWYVGLEFEGDARELVNRGEIDAVSVEGFATRVAKVETFSKPGTADVTASDTKKIEPLARYYLSKPHPFTECVRDQVKHGLPQDHANRRCAVLLDKFDPQRLRHSVAKEAGEWTEDDIAELVSQAESGSFDVVDEPTFNAPSFWTRAIAKAGGIDLYSESCGVSDCEGECYDFAVDDEHDDFPEDATELAKAKLDAKQRKQLPKSAFAIPEKAPGPGSFPIHDRAHRENAMARAKGHPQEARIRKAVCSRDPSLPACKMVAKSDPEMVRKALKLAQSLGHVSQELRTEIFKNPTAYMDRHGDPNHDGVVDSKERVAKDGEASRGNPGTVGSVELDERVDSIESRIAGLEKTLIGTDEEPGQIAKIAASVEKLAKTDEEREKEREPEPSTIESLEKRIDTLAEEFAGKVEPIAKELRELQEGESNQPETNGKEPVAKSGEPATAGILFS